MPDPKITFVTGAIGPISVDELKVINRAIANAAEDSVDADDKAALRKGHSYFKSIIEEFLTAG